MLALCARANHWNPNEYQYSNNMTVIGIIAFDDVEQRSESLEIGAFCAEECRGSAIAQYDTNFDRYYVCIMIYGNDGDSISIRCYDYGLGKEVDAVSQTSFIFNANDMIGNAVEPVLFSFDIHEIPEDPENPENPVDPEMPVDTIYYKVTAEANTLAGGTIDGVGEYLENDTCTLQITTSLNYVYEGLFENDTLVTNDTIYSFVVLSDRHFIAEFVLKEFEVSVSVNPEEGGTVAGGGIYKYGDEVSVAANPNDGYIFLNWTENDSVLSEDADYTFIITSDRNIIANFEKIEEPDEPGDNPDEPTESVEELVSSYNIYPNPASDFIMIENANQYDVTMYDMSGRVVLEEKPNDGRINVSHLPDGTYIVSVNKESTIVIINRR